MPQSRSNTPTESSEAFKRPEEIKVIGAGLAGSEAAWQIAERGIPVRLYEMRPRKMTEAHKTASPAELVCSNSFGSDSPHSASRILKEEVARLDSMLLPMARQASVPAGQSLAVDRVEFSRLVKEALENHPKITIENKEVTELDPGQLTVMATGPLTSEPLVESLGRLVGQKSLYFYDAISPIVSADSLDRSQMFYGNRYDKGDTKDFINIPLTEEQYNEFVDDLLSAEVVLPQDFEKELYFEGCMPIEAIAERGRRTLAFGPMKPVGLHHPETGKRSYAVIQLRAENRHLTAYNLVGFQTKLKWGEQQRIFSKLPGLQNAEFLRLGSMHRNTYVDSPRVLTPTLQLDGYPNLFLAGQLTGTEGYLESLATGLLAGINASLRFSGEHSLVTLPETTMLGALMAAVCDETKDNFQPINANMGLLPPLEPPVRKNKRLRNEKLASRAQLSMHMPAYAQSCPYPM